MVRYVNLCGTRKLETRNIDTLKTRKTKNIPEFWVVSDAEVYSESFQTPVMEFFAIIVRSC